MHVPGPGPELSREKLARRQVIERLADGLFSARLRG